MYTCDQFASAKLWESALEGVTDELDTISQPKLILSTRFPLQMSRGECGIASCALKTDHMTDNKAFAHNPNWEHVESIMRFTIAD